MRGVMLNSTSLTSVTVGWPLHVARTSAWVVSGPVTVHAYLPAVAEVVAVVAIVCHVAPPSRLTATSTGSSTPRLCVNVMLCTVPARQVTAVLGAVIVSAGSAIVNVTSLTSVAGVSSDLTLTTAAVVAGPVTVHENAPVVAVAFSTDAASACQLAPPSRDSSMLTNDDSPRLCVQLMSFAVPMAQVSAVFGVLTESAGAP